MRLAVLVASLLACSVGAACASGAAGAAGAASRHVGTYEATGEGGDAAVLEGTVRRDDGCLLIEDATGRRHLVWFPEDEVAWVDGGLRYAGSTYGEGDSIALGGGATPGAPGAADVPELCRGRTEDLPRWTVAQSG